MFRAVRLMAHLRNHVGSDQHACQHHIAPAELAAQWGEHPIKAAATFIFPAASYEKDAANNRIGNV